MIGLLSAVLTGSAMFLSAFAAEDYYRRVGYGDIEVDQSCINIAGVRYSNVDPRLNQIIEYDVDIFNNVSGFTDITVALYYPEELEVIPNEEDEPATDGDITSRGQTESVLDTENYHHRVVFRCHCEKNNMKEGTLFSVQLRVPIDAKSFDKYPLNPEVLALNNLNGEQPYNILNGYIEILTPHDDFIFYKGDMDLSHSVNVADAQLVLKEYVKTVSGQESTLRADYRLLADIDENGTVDVADAQLLLKYCTERTALNDVTWEQILGKEPKCLCTHISYDTFNDLRGI